MKEIKEWADKDNSKILDEEFLENTLYPIVDSNNQKRKRKMISIATALGIGIVAVFGVGFGIFHRSYTENYETKKSDIVYLNSNLTYTRLIGNFETVNLTYETHRKTPVYFSVYRVEEGDGWMQSLSMKVIVQRDYKIEELVYLDQIEYLGYTVYFSEMKKADSSTEPTLYAYKADAFIDTGAERYVMEYAEFRIENNYHFAEYLLETIKQK